MSVWSFVVPLNFVDVVGDLIDYLLTLTLIISLYWKKTKLNQSWIFETDSNITLEDSIIIYDGKKIEKTKQIVISNYATSAKKTEQVWGINFFREVRRTRQKYTWSPVYNNIGAFNI